MNEYGCASHVPLWTLMFDFHIIFMGQNPLSFSIHFLLGDILKQGCLDFGISLLLMTFQVSSSTLVLSLVIQAGYSCIHCCLFFLNFPSL